MTPLSLGDFPDNVSMPERRRIRFLTMLVAGPPDPLEWLLGTLKIVFGCWMLATPAMFAISPHVYRYVAQFPEPGWGTLFLLLGIAQWISWNHEHYKARYWVGVAAAALWDVYGFRMWMGDHRAPALAFLTVIALGQLLAVGWLYVCAFPYGYSCPPGTTHEGK